MSAEQAAGPVDPREPVTQAERDEFEALNARVLDRARVVADLSGVGQLGLGIESERDTADVRRWMYLADRILVADMPVVWAALRARMPRDAMPGPTFVQLFAEGPDAGRSAT